MDAIGFGLEQFDAIGAFRTDDKGTLIEPAGSLLGETDFADAVGLGQAIRQNPKLGPCAIHKVLTYAMGRGFSDEERCMVDAIDAQAAQADYAPEAVVDAIITPAFYPWRCQP